MHTPADLAAILPTLPRLVMNGHAFRCIDYKYLAVASQLHPNRFLYGLGAPVAGARFTSAGGPQAIYMAENQATAFAESNPVQAIVGKIDPGLAPPTPPGAYASIMYQLQAVLDVTDVDVQAALGTTRGELMKPWRQEAKRGHVSSTQQLGQAVYDSGVFQAIWYESARTPNTYCLAVFIDRLVAPAYLEVFDPNNNINERVP
jgi:RES domain-containing protein